MRCAHCHRELEGRRRTYCDARCKMRAYRRRRAGLPEDAMRAGGRRGHVPLAGKTGAEALSEIAERLRTAGREGFVGAKAELEELGTREAARWAQEIDVVLAELAMASERLDRLS